MLNFDEISNLGIPCYSNELESLNKCEPYFKDAVFFDVGAHLGLWSLAALQCDAKFVVGFDPWPVEMLCRNLSRFAGKYRTICAFVTDKEHTNFNDFSITIDDFVERERKVTLFGNCPVSSNDLKWRQIYTRPNFIKIDVEGQEMEVLRGGEKTIRLLKPALLIESHDYKIPGMKQRIDKLLKSWEYGEPLWTSFDEGGGSSKGQK